MFCIFVQFFNILGKNLFKGSLDKSIDFFYQWERLYEMYRDSRLGPTVRSL